MEYLWKEQDLRGLGLILMFQTGMRVGELAALRRESVYDGKIVITGTEEVYTDPATGRKICEVADHAKTEAGERTIILPAQAERTLKAIRVKNPFGEYLFMDKLGRIRGKRFNTWLKRACRKVGIPERSTHKIRKTYASMLLGAGVDEKLVTSQMGHTDISLTKGIYYYNRDSEQAKKQAITHAIDF
jgi:integrase